MLFASVAVGRGDDEKHTRVAQHAEVFRNGVGRTVQARGEVVDRKRIALREFAHDGVAGRIATGLDDRKGIEQRGRVGSRREWRAGRDGRRRFGSGHREKGGRKKEEGRNGPKGGFYEIADIRSI